MQNAAMHPLLWLGMVIGSGLVACAGPEAGASAPERQAQVTTARQPITVTNAGDVIELRSLTAEIAWIHDVAWLPDNNSVVAGTDQALIVTWNAATGNVNGTIAVQRANRPPQEVVATDDRGTYIAAGGPQGVVRVWNISDLSIAMETPSVGWVQALAFTPDGHLLTAHSGPQRIPSGLVVWDIASGEVVMHYEPAGNMTAAAISKDGTLVAGGDDTGAITIWDAASGEVLQQIDQEGYGSVTDLAFSPDGSLLASGGSQGGLAIWEVGTGQLKYLLDEATGFISGVAFSPDGLLLASGNRDGAAMLWDATTGEELLRYEVEQAEGSLTLPKVNAVQFSPDGALIALGTSDGTVRILGLPE